MLTEKAQTGFTLVELIIAVAIFSLLLGLGIPAYKDWMTRTKIRVTAETLVAGLVTTRNQALQRNAPVIFSLTDTLEAGCARASNATNWVISLANPSGSCNAAPSETDAPRIIEKRSGGEGGSSNTTVAALTAANEAATNVVFNGLGRVMTMDSAGNAMNPISVINIGKRIDPGNPDDSMCMTPTGDGVVRCLRIELTPGGGPRICDPAVGDANDPRYCTP